MNRLTVIGIGFKPLDRQARDALSAATFVVTSRRLEEVFTRYPEYEGVREKVRMIDNVDDTMRFIQQAFDQGVEEIVLIASGDPLFFGIGRRSVREFGSEAVQIIPDLTSLQTAFSRVKVAWDDALFMSLHAGPDPGKRRRLRYELKDLPELLERYNALGILTDKENNPATIARTLAESAAGPPSLRVYVGEKMGYEDERVTEGSPEEIARMSFEDPNVVIVRRLETEDREPKIGNRKSGSAPAATADPSEILDPRSEIRNIVFGFREDEIAHSGGMITKDEVRAVAIHALRLPSSGVLWDIGAGSGAMSIEAARLCPGLDVFAVEKGEEQRRHIRRNSDAFATRNLTVVDGEAPEVLSSLPDPHRVFIGGSGNKLPPSVRTVAERMQAGIVVINTTTLETLNDALQSLEETGFDVRVSEVSVARSKSMGGKRHMTALNPIFVITGEKSSEK